MAIIVDSNGKIVMNSNKVLVPTLSFSIEFITTPQYSLLPHKDSTQSLPPTVIRSGETILVYLTAASGYEVPNALVNIAVQGASVSDWVRYNPTTCSFKLSNPTGNVKVYANPKP